jgi:hypothetical protein
MSRLSVLVNRPRRTLAALATVLVAVGITAASGADFTATSANADTTFATGTLTIENSKQAQAIFASTSDMRPGDPARTGQVDIKNTGSLSGVFKLKRGAVSDSNSTTSCRRSSTWSSRTAATSRRAPRPATAATPPSTPARSPR